MRRRREAVERVVIRGGMSSHLVDDEDGWQVGQREIGHSLVQQAGDARAVKVRRVDDLQADRLAQPEQRLERLPEGERLDVAHSVGRSEEIVLRQLLASAAEHARGLAGVELGLQP